MKGAGEMLSFIHGFNPEIGNAVLFTAYLDPGTGSMIMQVLVFAFVAAGAFVKIYWNKVKGLFSKKKDS